MEVLAHLRRSRVKGYIPCFFKLINKNMTVKTKTKVFCALYHITVVFPRLKVPHDYRYPTQSVPHKYAISEKKYRYLGFRVYGICKAKIIIVRDVFKLLPSLPLSIRHCRGEMLYYIIHL